MKLLEIRQLVIEDYETVIDLWKNTEGIGLSDADSKENIKNYLERNPGLSSVAVLGGEIVGAVLSGQDGRRGYLYHLAVRKDNRLQGIGKKLVNNSLQMLQKIGIDKCHIFVYQENEDGLSFWTQNGWQTRLDLTIMSRYTEY